MNELMSKWSPAIQKAWDSLGYTTLTPVQEAVIPLVMAGHDVIAQADTGSGTVRASIARAGIDARQLDLEVTESTLISGREYYIKDMEVQ